MTPREWQGLRGKPATSKPLRLWGGFCDGVLNVYRSDDGGAVFKTRRAALAQYTDVRRVEIREVGR